MAADRRRRTFSCALFTVRSALRVGDRWGNMSEARAPPLERETSVFLSYSRRDASFVSGLASELSDLGYEAVYDLSNEAKRDPDMSLTAQDEWWSQLQTMIAAADVVVLVVTP